MYSVNYYIAITIASGYQLSNVFCIKDYILSKPFNIYSKLLP